MKLEGVVYPPAATAVTHCKIGSRGYAGTIPRNEAKRENRERWCSSTGVYSVTPRWQKGQCLLDELFPYRPLNFSSGSNPKSRLSSHPSIPSISQRGCIALYLLFPSWPVAFTNDKGNMRIKGLRLACVKKLTKAGLTASFNNHLSDSVLIFVAHSALDSNELETQLLLSSRGRDIPRLYIFPPVSRIGICVSSWI